MTFADVRAHADQILKHAVGPLYLLYASRKSPDSLLARILPSWPCCNLGESGVGSSVKKYSSSRRGTTARRPLNLAGTLILAPMRRRFCTAHFVHGRGPSKRASTSRWESGAGGSRGRGSDDQDGCGEHDSCLEIGTFHERAQEIHCSTILCQPNCIEKIQDLSQVRLSLQFAPAPTMLSPFRLRCDIICSYSRLREAEMGADGSPVWRLRSVEVVVGARRFAKQAGASDQSAQKCCNTAALLGSPPFVSCLAQNKCKHRAHD